MKLRLDLLEHLTAEDIKKAAIESAHRYKPEPNFSKTGIGSLSSASTEGTCQRSRAQHGTNSETGVACAKGWQNLQDKTLTLAEALDQLRLFHKRAPSLFFNGNYLCNNRPRINPRSFQRSSCRSKPRNGFCNRGRSGSRSNGRNCRISIRNRCLEGWRSHKDVARDNPRRICWCSP
jgi:hypothetical protein